MSYSSTYDATTTDQEGLRRAVVPVGAAAFLVAAGWTYLGANSTTEYLVMIPAEAVVTAVVFGLLLPRALRRASAGGTALTLSVVAALLAIPAFWTGLPMILGSAGAVLGAAGRNGRAGAGKATVALVVGVLAVLAYLAIYVADTLANS